MRPLLARDEISKRLSVLFPRDAFDPVLSSPLAAAAIAAMLYTDAIRTDDADSADNTGWLRPTTVLWLSDEVYAREDEASRVSWRAAALGGKGRSAVEDLHESWGIARDARWYRDNSRETVRDETFPAWQSFGAVARRVNIPSTSSKPAWALLDSFADLFDPDLTEDLFDDAVTAWRDGHMSPGERLRIATEAGRGQQEHQIEVRLPGGGTRSLEPGEASQILRGVLEEWAPARLADPVVLTISEPGDKVYLQDAARLKSLGVTIDPQTLLPDAVIADIGSQPVTFWIVEVSASDGVVSEDRLQRLQAWAADNRIPVEDCEYLTAFRSRISSSARRRLKDLAAGTYAWFLAEPGRELSWREIEASPTDSGS
ncbi:hypothetical protein GCM10022234_22450 [Aeromicrobium panaciterrae]|uniref:BsuBI/PstI family type II restriction endonuclease n=1 Tax=Aeromicrobium panaciterrae TaxID=363861 RepID=UPI0031D660C2